MKDPRAAPRVVFGLVPCCEFMQACHDLREELSDKVERWDRDAGATRPVTSHEGYRLAGQAADEIGPVDYVVELG